MKKDKPSIIEFVTDRQLLGLSLSTPQEVLLRAIYGMPLSASQREIFTLCTGREDYPGTAFQEATILCGARAGKDSRAACPIASYEACFAGHERHLSRGEQAIIPLVAPGSLGTRVAFGYIKSHFTDSKYLRNMLEDEPLQNEIRLKNRISVLCFPCTKSSLRSWSIPVGILDELAFYKAEGSADSDAEIQSSIRRGMINFPSTRLVKISTPFGKSGLLYDDFKNFYGKDSPDLLCWKASSLFMNPSLRASRLETEKRLDPLRFAREYEAEFSEDLDTFIPAAWVEAAVIQGRHELTPANFTYTAAVDVSGLGSGSNADSFTLSIVHGLPDGRVVQDFARGWKKSRFSFISIAGILGEIKNILTQYRVNAVHGDAYGKTWVSERFAEAGISYVQVDHDKSFYYLATEPLFAQGRVELLDNDDIAKEFRMLERRMLPGGKIKIDHASGLHDDHANSFAIAAALATQGKFDISQIKLIGKRRMFDSTRNWTAQREPHDEGGVVTIGELWDSGALTRRSRWDW